MKTLAQFLVVAALGTGLTAGSARENGSIEQRVRDRLRPVLAGLTPAPTFEFPEGSKSLLVYYRPRKFLVHNGSMTGEWSTNVVEEVGPRLTGFVLRIKVEGLGEVNQAVTPQTLQEPYWRTFLDLTPIAGTTNQIYWALSFTGRTDQKMLTKVKQALGSLAGRKPTLTAEPSQPIRSETSATTTAAGFGR